MRIIIIFLLSFLISFPSFAKQYAVQRDDGGISVVNYVEGSSKSLEQVLKDQNLSGKPMIEVTDRNLPSREDRNFWKMVNGKIEVDLIKKQAHIAKLAQEEAEKRAIYEKLKISKEEFEKIKK